MTDSGFLVSLGAWVEGVGQDVRSALRGLARAPVYTLVAVLSLAVGIGVNTGLFTYIQAALLEPVPGVTGADRVVEVLLTRAGREHQEWSYPDFEDVRTARTPMAAMAGWKTRDESLTAGDRAEHVRVTYASASYFHVLGVVPARGRGFLPAEDVGPGEHPVAVLSHDAWQRWFAGDPAILGGTVLLNRRPYTVVGVAPERFTGHQPLAGPTDLWVPLVQHPFMVGPSDMTRDRGAQWLLVLGRLGPDATVDQTSAALRTVFAGLAQAHPGTNRDRSARAYRFSRLPAYGRVGSVMFSGALVALSGLVLLIICGNVTGMMLARSVIREREIAVRMALGSTRSRLVRHLMVEALLLALVGGGLGLLVVFWGAAAVSSTSLAFDLPGVTLRPDGTIIIYSLGLVLAATVAVGLLPALRFSRPELVSSLKDDTGGGGRRAGRVHRYAVAAQAGLTLFLLASCGLSLRAVQALGRRDLGFEPRGLLVTRLDLAAQGYETLAQALPFLDDLTASLHALPGLEWVALADGIPLDLMGSLYTAAFPADGGDLSGGGVRVELNRASESYFAAIGARLARGRGFEPRDDAGAEPVTVLTQSAAERLWPGQDPLGQRVRLPVARDSVAVVTVVGVVRDMAASRPNEDWPQVFVPLRQHFRPSVTMVIRGEAAGPELGRIIQAAILDADPRLPIPQVETAEAVVRRSTQGQRAWAGVAGGLGLLALLLSAIGVYGVVAFAVGYRTREIGVRMALGATRLEILGTVLRDATRLAVPGMAAGLLLALAAGFAMRSILLGVSPADPVTFASATGLLFLVVLLASLIPARRASSVEPMEALRAARSG